MSYEKLRVSRIHMIKSFSERQGYLNHISNPILIMCRNIIMKFFPTIAMHSIKKVWNYDADKALAKITQ